MIFVTEDFHDFYKSSGMVVLARMFMLETQCFSSFFYFSYQLLKITEDQNNIGLFDAGFSFKCIHNS